MTQAAMDLLEPAVALDPTRAQAAERLEVPPWTLRRWMVDGRFPARRVGGTLIRLSVADVRALAEHIPAARAPAAPRQA